MRSFLGRRGDPHSSSRSGPRVVRQGLGSPAMHLHSPVSGGKLSRPQRSVLVSGPGSVLSHSRPFRAESSCQVELSVDFCDSLAEKQHSKQFGVSDLGICSRASSDLAVTKSRPKRWGETGLFHTPICTEHYPAVLCTTLSIVLLKIQRFSFLTRSLPANCCISCCLFPSYQLCYSLKDQYKYPVRSN